MAAQAMPSQIELEPPSYLYDLFDYITIAYGKASSFSSSVPGSAIFFRYIKNSYQNDPFRVILELLLVFFALKYLLSQRYSPGNNDVTLTKKEIQELIDEWTPEPLVPELTESEKTELEKIPTIVSQPGAKVKIANSSKTLVNLISCNPLGILGNEKIKEKAIAALRKYGVGACGPPGFYGTIDVHMKLEKDIAEFLGTEQAIIYAQGYSALSSVIPAFSKRGDLIICDDGVGFAIQKGVQISRSRVIYFKHNDMDDLERILQEQADEDYRLKRPLTRKFIVVEGLYGHTGDLAPLPKLIELKYKFKYRLLVDESQSFGVLGKSGKGITDYYNVPVTDIDFIVSSMSNSLCAAGGFCTGMNQIVEHQRLSSNAYVFSAALPPMLAVAASEAIDMLKSDGPNILSSLRENIAAFRNTLASVSQITLSEEHSTSTLAQSPPSSPSLSSLSSSLSRRLKPPAPEPTTPAPQSPLILISLSPSFITSKSLSSEVQDRVLQDIVDEAMKDGVLVTKAKYLDEYEMKGKGKGLEKGLKVFVTAGLTKKETEKAAYALKNAILRVTKRI
ncbi:pyridoxal phosphate-dependent transferase [Paraphysoderma sedebokerense]|nr:pyridoxal phosphate-dependent transferase [Paraphysoderma sedebokerense]